MVARFHDRIDADLYLENKEFFDSTLLKVLDEQNKKINRLKKYRADDANKIANYREKVHGYVLKAKKQKQEISMLSKSNKSKDKEIDKLKKDVDELSRTISVELEETYHQNIKIEKENNELIKENERLKKELEILRRKYKLDSTNSSKPSSTDGFKVRPKNMRETTGRHVGGQAGHSAHLSKLSENPLKIIEKHVKKVPTGAVAVKDENYQIIYYRTQKIDAKFKVEIYETRYFVDQTAEPLNEDEMKKYKINSVSYTPQFAAIVLYLNNKGYIALDRLCKMLNEMSDGVITLKPSTICEWNKKFAEKSSEEKTKILKDILDGYVKHVDETGLKTNGKNTWMHVISNENGAYFIATEKRVDKEKGPIKIMENTGGVVSHDHLKPYYDLLLCSHAECNAHVLRYLKAGMEEDSTDYSRQMSDLLKSMLADKKEHQATGKNAMDDETIRAYEKEYLRIIETGLKDFEEKHPNTEAKYTPDYIKLFRRMKEYKDQHLYFIRDFNVPFENNEAERQLRIVKTKKKVSGQFKNIETENDFASMLTIMQTSKKRNKNTLKAIESILDR